MGIGKRIKQARERLNITQKELGHLIGVTGSAITNYENEVSHPKEPVMYKLLEVLKVDANYLFQDEMKAAQKGDETVLALDEYPIIVKYRRLNDSGKEYIDSQLDYALSQERYSLEKETTPASQSDVG